MTTLGKVVARWLQADIGAELDALLSAIPDRACKGGL